MRPRSFAKVGLACRRTAKFLSIRVYAQVGFAYNRAPRRGCRPGDVEKAPDGVFFVAVYFLTMIRRGPMVPFFVWAAQSLAKGSEECVTP
jgi:hypothetical protein